jgi:hypothetical protein
MSHTPGPWEIAETTKKKNYLEIDAPAAGFYGLARVWLHGEIGDGNARLVAAAPELLAACELALRILHSYLPPDQFDGHAAQALILIRDAVARAKGN